MDSLTRRRTGAFTLMELLVAVSLLSVVLLLAGLLLAGARSLYNAVFTSEEDPSIGFRVLQDDLDHLLRRAPELILHPAEGLRWTRIVGESDLERLPVEVFYLYAASDRALLRLHRPPGDEDAGWTTNQVFRSVRRWDWRLETPDGPRTVWPPEGEDTAPLPGGISVIWEIGDAEGESVFLIPAAMRREAEAASP